MKLLFLFTRLIIVGGLLGFVWFVVLLVPPWTRHELTGENGRSWWLLMILMVLSSAFLSTQVPVVLRSANRRWKIITSIALPFGGALLFSALVFILDMATMFLSWDVTLDKNPNGPIAGAIGAIVGMTWVAILGIPIMAISAFAMSCYVAVPMGFVHTYVIRKIDRSTPKVGTDEDREQVDDENQLD